MSSIAFADACWKKEPAKLLPTANPMECQASKTTACPKDAP
eukprot:CAMPEP_0181506890 /NCGR_PEP_ID=MMETSP1110-20121109/58837_1 /TAXON_ID=174948 /ORGANISM="Symbiodinium sp., Strain CCMP421" /LENGTH=40 /DNA_ID= /DNA_START= /DNA_END= /DNA_ORIENTATION=